MQVEEKISPWASENQKFSKEKRNSYKVEIRRNKRNALFNAKRGIVVPGSIMVLPDLPDFFGIDEKLTDLEKVLTCKWKLEEKDCFSFKVLKYLSCNLDTFREDFIGIVFGVGLVPVLKQFLNLKEMEENLREASGIICGITFAPHEYVKILVKNDIILSLILTSCHSSIEIAANCIWGLSNIMMDCKKYWNYVMDRKFSENFQSFCKRFNSCSDIWKKTVMLGIKALLSYKDECFFSDFVNSLETLKIMNKKGFEWKSLNVLMNLAKDPSQLELIERYGYLNHYFEALYFEGETLMNGLEFLASVKFEDSKSIETLIQYNLLEKLSKIFDSSNFSEVELAFWAFDCFLRNNPNCVSYVVGNKITDKVCLFLMHPNEKVRLESSFVMLNLITNCDKIIIRTFRMNETESLLMQGLKFPDPEYLKNTLNCLKTLSRYIPIQENCLFQFINKLEFHANPEIKALASEVLNINFS
jgi:hypothetical protein